jgi:indole-3-pyruvate monooxygenase
MFPFPDSYPMYLTRDQFVSYLDDYAERFHIKPEFNTAVSKAEFLADFGIWAVSVVARPAAAMEHDTSGPRAAAATQQYVCFAKWLVVATGENAEAFMPSFQGHEDYKGNIMHGSLYRNGKDFCAKKVLVVGCGNTGMEVALDLANYGALPSLCIRDRVKLPVQLSSR